MMTQVTVLQLYVSIDIVNTKHKQIHRHTKLAGDYTDENRIETTLLIINLQLFAMKSFVLNQLEHVVYQQKKIKKNCQCNRTVCIICWFGDCVVFAFILNYIHLL